MEIEISGWLVVKLLTKVSQKFVCKLDRVDLRRGKTYLQIDRRLVLMRK